jgi:hypothetical protein
LWSLLAAFPEEAFHCRHQELLAIFPSFDSFYALAVGCIELVLRPAKAWSGFFGLTTSVFFTTYLTSLEALFRPPSIYLARRKLGLPLRV